MNSDIHQVLKDAGVAKGINADDVEIIMIFSNPGFFQAFRKSIQGKVEKGIISREKGEGILREGEEIHKKAMGTQDQYREKIQGLYSESQDRMHSSEKKQIQNDTDDLNNIVNDIDSFLSS